MGQQDVKGRYYVFLEFIQNISVNGLSSYGFGEFVYNCIQCVPYILLKILPDAAGCDLLSW